MSLGNDEDDEIENFARLTSSIESTIETIFAEVDDDGLESSIRFEVENLQFEVQNMITNDTSLRNLLQQINPGNPEVTDMLERVRSANDSSIFEPRVRSTSSTSNTSTVLPLFNETSKIDGLTYAPLPESAKIVQINDVYYESVGLCDFFLATNSVRNPFTGEVLSDKSVDLICEKQTPEIQERIRTLASSSLPCNVRSIKTAKIKYFEDVIFKIVARSIALCELDHIINLHVTMQNFNKHHFPILLRSFSGLALLNPNHLLSICSKITDQIDVLKIANDGHESGEEVYIYHPVVFRSIMQALDSLCALCCNQYFTAQSNTKFAGKICETPIARIQIVD